MSSEQHFDWQEVVNLAPKGYLEIQNPQKSLIIHGPIERVSIDDSDFVHIILKWAATAGTPGADNFQKWVNAPQYKDIAFPNLMAPFVFQDTPNKGRRILFAGFNILYFEAIEGLDPSRVKGLVPAST